MPRWLEHKIPPPVIDAALATLMWALARALPGTQLWPPGGHAWVWAAAIALALAGGGIALAGLWALAQARTTVNPLALRGQLRAAILQGQPTEALMKQVAQAELEHMQARERCATFLRSALTPEQYGRLTQLYLEKLR